MSVFIWSLLVLAVLCLLGFVAYQYKQRSKPLPQAPVAAPANSDYKISYAPSDMEWSGSTAGVSPLKTLTYKQYEWLEDARYGFRIIGVTPSERKNPQPHKTRAHGLKTVASLVRHGFLTDAGAGAYVINDMELNALAVCGVRY